MNKLKVIQQRVFCIFLRPYQRTERKPNQLVQLDFSMLRWSDPTADPSIKPFMPIGPSNLIENEDSTLTAVTDPPNTRQLRYQQRALQFYKFETDSLSEEPISIQPYITTSSKNMQPFNEDQMFTEDLWLLHSTWTSFEKTKLVARSMIDAFGVDAIMVCAYVPMDIELLPNK